jgi:tetratricopeptide (TPR) repeat protein
MDGDGEHSGSVEFVFALSYLSRVYFALGCLDQAAAACNEALAAARRSADAVSIAIALLARMFLATHSADIEDAAAYVEEASAHYAAHGLPLFEQWAIFNRGALLVRLGNIEAGIKLMQSSIVQADARQSPMFRPFQLQCIGGAYLQLGNFDQAIANVDEGLSIVAETGEKWSEPGLHRTRGEILMALGRRPEAYDNFKVAMTAARRQGAALEMLRIATALARYAASAKEVGEARELLSAIYAKLEEGRDTIALRAAREQLAILEGKGSGDDQARHSA